MLIGEFHHSLDDKNRLIIPSKLRSELEDEVIITRGLDKCLFIYSKTEWNKIVNELSKLPFTRKDARNFNRFFLSGASLTGFDKQGRINIVQTLLDYALITREVTIIGVNDRIEVWDKDSYETFIKDNENNFSDMAESLFSGVYDA